MASELGTLHVPVAARPLPAGWSWNRLDAVCEGVFDCPHSTPVLTEAGPYVVRSQDIRSGVFRSNEAAHVSEETYRERISRVEPRHGDLLYSREGTYFGIAAEVPQRGRLCLGQRMVLLRPLSTIALSRFILYWLNSPLMASHIHGFRDGSVAERLNMPTIRGLPVALPPLAEQRAIAHVLGTLDDKIELNRRMNETLEAMTRALFQSWFVDFDPVRAKAERRDLILPSPLADLFPPHLVDSELGEIPAGWEVRRLGDVVDTVKGRSYKSEELAESSVALVTLKSFARGGGYRPEGLKSFTGDYKQEQVIEPGEVVVACTDVTQAAEVIGRAAIVRRARRFKTLVASLDTMIVRPRARWLSRAFLYCLGRSKAFVAHTYSHSTGTTVLHLSREAVPSFTLAVPPQELVERFDVLAGSAMARGDALEEESENLAALRDTMLPKLVSGELRITDAERLGGLRDTTAPHGQPRLHSEPARQPTPGTPSR